MKNNIFLNELSGPIRHHQVFKKDNIGNNVKKIKLMFFKNIKSLFQNIFAKRINEEKLNELKCEAKVYSMGYFKRIDPYYNIQSI